MGQRAERFTGTIKTLVEDVESNVESLLEEIEEWKGSMESNGMEHLPKFEEVSEAYDGMECVVDGTDRVHDAIRDLPADFQEKIATYVQDTRKKSVSRAHRLANISLLIEAVQTVVSAEVVRLTEEQEQIGDDGLLSLMIEAEDACEDWDTAASAVCFPSMF